MLCANSLDADSLELNLNMSNILNHSSYNISTSSESTIETSFSFHESKYPKYNNDKKVHWTPSQVLSLLDCIEKRASDFRKKSVQKSVWISIGQEMIKHGNFSVEHCYNKWKNLRRDVRHFISTNNMQKLNNRNSNIMDRVHKLIVQIGYKTSYEKSILSNLDAVDQTDSSDVFDSPGFDASVSYNQIQSKGYINSSGEITEFNERHNDSNISSEESVISLLSNSSFSQAILTNPKLLEDILIGVNVPTLLTNLINTESRLDFNTHPNESCTTMGNITAHNKTYKKKYHNNEYQSLFDNEESSASNIDFCGNSWPLQLHELLHSFRDEEYRQTQRLDQIGFNIQGMQDSTTKRMGTINQLISLTEMLIPQR